MPTLLSSRAKARLPGRSEKPRLAVAAVLLVVAFCRLPAAAFGFRPAEHDADFAGNSGTTGASHASFRPPATPIITTDPFMQVWLMGTDATADVTRHWESSPKEVTGLLRLDGAPYRFLGACGPSSVLPESECPPPLRQLSVRVEPTSTAFEFESPGKEVHLSVEFLSTLFTDNHTLLSRPVSYINHAVTSLDGNTHKIELYIDATAQHCVNSPDEEVVWSDWDNKPTSTLRGVKIGSHVQPVLGMSGDKVNINWGWLHMAAPHSSVSTSSSSGSSSSGPSAVLRAGSAVAQRRSFIANGTLPSYEDLRMPRQVQDDMPAVAAAFSFSAAPSRPRSGSDNHNNSNSSGGASSSCLVLLGYDDVRSIYYFGQEMKGLWTQSYGGDDHGIVTAMEEAASGFPEALKKARRLSVNLRGRLRTAGGKELENIGVLSYRQTLAATKLAWNPREGVPWNFLKEISTNGDMNTVDVVFPASPLFLALDPSLLKLLLLPTLNYANNATWHPFTDPYSPHQLGKYPIANDTAAKQEPMPMENTGNMFLMLLGIAQQEEQEAHHDHQQRSSSSSLQWLYPRYWPLLVAWAEELEASLPYPAKQLCTDDFTGALANNTNLAAKGIIALEAFAELCRTVQRPSSSSDDDLSGRRGGGGGGGLVVDCGHFSAAARRHAATWMREAFEAAPEPHFKIAFHEEGSYSLKYNLLWQKLLGLNGPFPWGRVVAPELKFYLSRRNAYGTPLDMRHSYVKLDWLAWAACMADDGDDETFHTLFDPIFRMANETGTRAPLTDLFDTETASYAKGDKSFVARPVVGAVYAKLLLSERYSKEMSGNDKNGHRQNLLVQRWPDYHGHRAADAVNSS